MQTDINNFIKLGYYLDYDSDFIVKPSRVEIPNSSDIDLLVLQARAIIMDSFEDILKNNSSSDIVVPISGGFDSRLVLAFLLEFFNADKIKTYTFGVPGAYDFEIGGLVAKKLGTQHNNIDLSILPMTIDDVLYNNNKVNGQCTLFYSTPFHYIDTLYDSSALHFSGFMGDPIAGSKIKKCYAQKDAIDLFFKDNIITDFSVNIDNKYIKSETSLLSNYENIDFHNRQAKYIKPHVAPNSQYICPFLSQKFIDFMFGLPHDHRENCSLYRDLCFHSNSSLFGLPVKDFHGLTVEDSKVNIWAKRISNHVMTVFAKYMSIDYVDKRTNYFDIRYKLSIDQSFSKTFHELYNVASLELSNLGLISSNESNRILKFSKNDNDLIVIASLGAQILSGKSW